MKLKEFVDKVITDIKNIKGYKLKIDHLYDRYEKLFDIKLDKYKFANLLLFLMSWEVIDVAYGYVAYTLDTYEIDITDVYDVLANYECENPVINPYTSPITYGENEIVSTCCKLNSFKGPDNKWRWVAVDFCADGEEFQNGGNVNVYTISIDETEDSLYKPYIWE